jgi:hypothetical protein
VPDQVKNAVWLAFRDDSDATADLAVNNVGRLQSQITGAHFNCTDAGADSTCEKDVLAYANQETGRISFCRPQFFADDISIYAQSESVIHEAAHLFLSMADHGYFGKGIQSLCEELPHVPGTKPTEKGSGTAGDNPAIRLENADSYVCLVHYLRYLDPATLQSKSAAYRGDNLTIDSLDDLGSQLYTQATTPQLHRFGIRGAPDASGFQYRWYLQAGSVSYTPASREAGNAGVFAEDNVAVYFPTAIGSLLEQNNVTQATLVCVVQIFGAYGDRFAPPLITKSLPLQVVAGPPPVNF